jgi:hypothetical protein
MESKMKNVIMLSVLALSLSNAVSAKTVSIGGLKGTSTVSIKEIGSNGEILRSSEATCRLGYNIRMNEGNIHLGYGVIACNTGMNTWNDINADLTISEGKILNGNVQVGEVLADGTAEFTLQKKNVESHPVVELDFDCEFKKVDSVEFNVGSEVNYKLRKATDGSIEMSRLETRTEVTTKFAPQHNDCRATSTFSIATKVIELEAKLVK